MNHAYDYAIIENDYQGFDSFDDYDEDCHMPHDDDTLPSLNDLSELSLYDIMGEDHYIYLNKNHNGTYALEISNEDAKPVVCDYNIHPFAVEGLALFCKRFLNIYSRYNPNIQGE